MWRKCLTLKVQTAEVGDGLHGLGIRGPDQREGGREAVNDNRLLRILGVLIEFHQSVPRQRKRPRRHGIMPSDGGGELMLEVDHHVRIQQAYARGCHQWPR